jgi:hypothetical protein
MVVPVALERAIHAGGDQQGFSDKIKHLLVLLNVVCRCYMRT